MELILLQKVTNLGNLGDKVNVKPGYGRNYLVPQGKAVPATAANLAEFEAKRAEYEAKAKSVHDEAEGRRAKLEGASVTIKANASTEGKLFGRRSRSLITRAMRYRNGRLAAPVSICIPTCCLQTRLVERDARASRCRPSAHCFLHRPGLSC